MSDTDTPYRKIAEALVAHNLALLELVLERRPEITQLGAAFVVSFDIAAQTIVVGLPMTDGRIVFVERILVDPTAPERFGASELPTAIAECPEGVH